MAGAEGERGGVNLPPGSINLPSDGQFLAPVQVAGPTEESGPPRPGFVQGCGAAGLRSGQDVEVLLAAAAQTEREASREAETTAAGVWRSQLSVNLL